MSVVVVATLYPQPGSRAQVIEVLERTIPRVHAEAGCELYALHEGEDRLVMVEKWASREALEAHLAAAPLRELSQALRALVSQPTEVQVLTPHPAGTAGQGTVAGG